MASINSQETHPTNERMNNMKHKLIQLITNCMKHQQFRTIQIGYGAQFDLADTQNSIEILTIAAGILGLEYQFSLTFPSRVIKYIFKLRSFQHVHFLFNALKPFGIDTQDDCVHVTHVTPEESNADTKGHSEDLAAENKKLCEDFKTLSEGYDKLLKEHKTIKDAYNTLWQDYSKTLSREQNILNDLDKSNQNQKAQEGTIKRLRNIVHSEDSRTQELRDDNTKLIYECGILEAKNKKLQKELEKSQKELRNTKIQLETAREQMLASNGAIEF